MQTPKPTLELLTCDAAYRENPTALFHQVCGDRPATLLLESADIDSKDDLKSLLLVDSALRITALGDTVTIQALSDNGASLLLLLDTALPAGVENEVLPAGRVLRFPPVSPLLDEDARLCSLSVFDAFRLLQGVVNIPTQEREAMFFGGLFAYDLVAGFEALPHLEAGNNCPDYCFYLAETLMVIDHQKKSTRIQASLFTASDREKQRLNARLAYLSQQLTQPAPPLPVTPVPDMRCECNQSDDAFGAVVRQLQKAIRAGEIFQVVPSRRFSLPCPSPLAAYYVLKKSNPSVRDASGFPGSGRTASRSRRAARLSRLHEHGHPERRAESTRHAVDCRCGRTAPRQLWRRGRLLHRPRRSGHLYCYPLRAGGERYRHRTGGRRNRAGLCSAV